MQLFERVKLGLIICIYSDLTETELLNAPEKIRNYFKKLPKENLEHVIVNDEILALASKYIDEKVVGQTSFDDCVHIATATNKQSRYFGELEFQAYRECLQNSRLQLD